MGNRYKEEKPFAFYDPERDWEGQRQQAPRNRSAPVSPRGAPVSPRAQPPGLYPEPDHGYRSGLPTSPREKPFGHYDPELDGERHRQGMSGSLGSGPPSPRPLDSDPGYRGLGSDPLAMAPGAPPNGTYGHGAPDARPYPPSSPNPNLAGVSGAPDARPYHPQPSPEFTGRGRGGGYGDPNPGLGSRGLGYPRPEMPGGRAGGAPLGRGMGAVQPMGDGRYVYGGIPRRLEMEEEDGAVPPAPISSEHAHQVYASVFSDPVYGAAGQFNSRAGYQEEPEELRQVHHRQDVLRHPDQY